MMSFKVAAISVALTLAGSALACSQNGKDGILPENNFYIPVGKSFGGLSQAQFNSALDRVETIYAPIVASMGGNLVVERKWDDGTVNAYATQSGKTWKVSMFGGLARHETITEDGMSLVICHEIGHHIGGAPKIGGSRTSGGWWGGGASASNWASNEGQADYFATLKCLRRTFLNDDNAAVVRTLSAPQSLIDACNKQNKTNKEDAAMCIRIGMAGKSVSNLFSVLSHTPDTKFETPDTKVVTSTFDEHPQAQCRLDTYFNGGLCEVSFNEDVSQTDEVKGTCHPSLGHKIGTRPLCWFKPKQ
ncbi:MAG: hypothetical protein ACJ76H_10795 [Bacteriovoracaceae bacterium]